MFASPGLAGETALAGRAQARAKLECLLQKQQASRADLVRQQTGAQRHLDKVEAFRSGLQTERNAESIALAEQAIARDRDALRRLGARLAAADRGIAQTRRAISDLNPPPAPLPLVEQARRAGKVALANAVGCNTTGAQSALADLSLPARLLGADFCGQRADQFFEENAGLSSRKDLLARLNRLVARLDTASPHTSVRLLAGCPAEGGGAFSTSTTSYLGECELDGRSDDEVAFVIAHERAHVLRQHLSLTYAMRALDAQMNAAPEGVTRPHILAASMAARLGDFDRDQEYEADRDGAVNALAAGFSPQGVDAVMNRLAEGDAAREAGHDPRDTAGAKVRSTTADHPSAADRRRALEEVLGPAIWSVDPAQGLCPSKD